MEDDESIRRLLANILKPDGYEVTTARHGAGALALVRERGPGNCAMGMRAGMPIVRLIP